MKLCWSNVSTLIATRRFDSDRLSCYSNYFFISLLRRISIEISSVFWQHSRTAFTIFDIVSDVRSQFYKFKSTAERLRSFKRQLAR
jgi:hypothetical protein